MAWYDFLDPITNLGSGIVNSVIGGKNYQLQKDMFKYQKELQKDIFKREDTAVQRRVKDLISAGLSPTLAAGDGAGAGSVVSTTTPQMDPVDLSTDFSSAASKAKQRDKMESEIDLIHKQLENLDSSIATQEANRAKLEADAMHTQAETSIVEYNLEYAKDNNLPYGTAASVKNQAASVLPDASVGNMIGATLSLNPFGAYEATISHPFTSKILKMFGINSVKVNSDGSVSIDSDRGKENWNVTPEEFIELYESGAVSGRRAKIEYNRALDFVQRRL